MTKKFIFIFVCFSIAAFRYTGISLIVSKGFSLLNFITFAESEVPKFVEEYHLQLFGSAVKESGCLTVVCFVKAWESPDTSTESKHIAEKALKIKQLLILKQWLRNNDLHHADYVFVNLGVQDLKQLLVLNNYELRRKLTHQQFNIWSHARSTLPLSGKKQDELKRQLWFEVEKEIEPHMSGVLFFLFIILFLFGVVLSMKHSSLTLCYVNPFKYGLFHLVTGKYLSPKKSKVVFEWNDPEVVGSTMTFTVEFAQQNGDPYPLSNIDNVLIEISQGSNKISYNIQLGGPHMEDANKAKVHFTVRRSGEYKINVLVDGIPIRGSPFLKTFIPGLPDPSKTCFVHQCSIVVSAANIPAQLFIEPRDCYGNRCIIQTVNDPFEEYDVHIVEVTSNHRVSAAYSWECYPFASRIALIVKFPDEGCYRTNVSYKGTSIQNGDFHIIILNREETALVQSNVAKKNKCYEVRLVSLNGERSNKLKKVYCYISPKQLTLKEFMWKFFPKHLITFRLCPSTKFNFQSKKNDLQGKPVLHIHDGCLQEVEFISSDRNVIAATFMQFLLKNIGGSETFQDKQDFFYHEVRKFHLKHFHDKIELKITRENILESSFKEMKGFGINDWCKNFEITFIGEEGLDWGGLRREWFELICSSLFDPNNLFFHTFSCDKQGLVHPCPSYKRPPNHKLKYYEFAGKIVGKCLYESALGSSYQQLVKAKFSRSFLAQLIGLSVHYKYFEQDDPDLFVNKIKYISEHDIEGMELYFSEEIYDNSGQLIAEVDLIPSGSSIPVTNENKFQYLNALAVFKLSTSVKQEIDHFLKGLNELVPDSLLCIFDENELELLMCGTGSYSISDFKANHTVGGSSYEFLKVLEWFWIAVSNFSAEEMARLLQFTTGCSQLPPGGFSELTPKFHITSAPTFGNLPSAHTCFNQLCLPDYDTYEQFEKFFRLAISEGSEGFGLV